VYDLKMAFRADTPLGTIDKRVGQGK